MPARSGPWPGMDRLPRIERPQASLRFDAMEACMDVQCACGATYHVDGRGAHYVRCPLCRTVFAVGSAVTVEALADEEAAALEGLGLRALEGDLDEDD